MMNDPSPAPATPDGSAASHSASGERQRSIALVASLDNPALDGGGAPAPGAPYSVDHSSSVAVLDPDVRLAAALP